MKPNLVKRIAAAVAFAGIAALVSACGSSNSAIPGVGGMGFPLANGAGCTGMSQAVAFSGVATMDQIGNIYAGQNVGPLTLSATSAAQGMGYQYGRVNSQDGSTLAFNISGAYGSQLMIQGIYVMGQDVLTILQTMGGSMMGYGSGYPGSYPGSYPGGYPYGSGGCGVSSLSLYQMGVEPMTQAAQVIGQQPFLYAVVSGELILNGSINAPY